MMPSDEVQLQSFIDILEKELLQADNAASGMPDSRLVTRNLALNLWLLQQRDASVRHKRLERLLGKSAYRSARPLLENNLNKAVIVASESASVYDRQLIDRIGAAFNKPEQHYRLSIPVAAFANVKSHQAKRAEGHHFLEWLSLLARQNKPRAVQSFLTRTLAEAFEKLLPGVKTEFPYLDFPVARISRVDENWSFLLHVLPKSGVLSRRDVNAIVAQDVLIKAHLQQQNSVDRLTTLLIAPGVRSEKVAKFLTDIPSLRYCSGLSALQFLNGLTDLIATGNPQAISDHFESIFIGEPNTRFSAMQALDQLKKKP